MAIERPAPGFLGRGLAKEEEVVGILVHDPWNMTDIAQEVIYSYGCEYFLVALWGKSALNDGKNGFCDAVILFFEAQTEWPEKELWVRPSPPFSCVERIRHLFFLLGVEFTDEILN
jgi:hypothetical protein